MMKKEFKITMNNCEHELNNTLTYILTQFIKLKILKTWKII